MYPTQLPPSSKTVLEILDAGGAMTHKDLVQKSHLAPRTVRYALKKLKERQLIIEKFNFRDARQIIYQNRAEDANKPEPACVRQNIPVPSCTVIPWSGSCYPS